MASKRHKLLAAGTVASIAIPLSEAAHFGGLGLIVALAAGAVAYAAVDEIEEATGREFSLPAASRLGRSAPGSHSLAYRLVHGKSTRSDDDEYDEDDYDDPDTDQLDDDAWDGWNEPHQRPQYIELSPEVILHPNEIVAKAVAIIAQRRSGKTTLAARLAEQLGDQDVPLFIPNSEGDLGSLYERLPRSVIAAAPDTYQQEDVRLWEVTPEYAEELGFQIMQEGYQVILEMDTFESMNDAWQVVIGVIDGMQEFSRQYPGERCPAAVFLDEAQKYLPEQINASAIDDRETRDGLLQAYGHLLSSGGKRGVAPVIVTQRIAETNNRIIAQAEIRFILRQTHDTDLKRCMKYVREEIATPEQIRAFAKGEGIYIADDDTQILTRFYQRESDGSRSATPQVEDVARFSAMPRTMQRRLPETPPPAQEHQESPTASPAQRQPNRKPLSNLERAVRAYLQLKADGKRYSQPAIARATKIKLWDIRGIWSEIEEEAARREAELLEEEELLEEDDKEEEGELHA